MTTVTELIQQNHIRALGARGRKFDNNEEKAQLQHELFKHLAYGEIVPQVALDAVADTYEHINREEPMEWVKGDSEYQNEFSRLLQIYGRPKIYVTGTKHMVDEFLLEVELYRNALKEANELRESIPADFRARFQEFSPMDVNFVTRQPETNKPTSKAAAKQPAKRTAVVQLIKVEKKKPAAKAAAKEPTKRTAVVHLKKVEKKKPAAKAAVKEPAKRKAAATRAKGGRAKRARPSA